MTVQEAYKQLQLQLCTLYDEREAANIADLVTEHVTGQRRIDRIVNKQLPVTDAQQNTIAQYTGQLLLHTPVQYVLHEAWFAGMKLYVDENVLIPRPETEELVSWIADCRLQIAGLGQPVTVLDIGTGSGCIPVALKKQQPGWNLHAVDVSAGVLDVARRNANKQGTAVNFYLLNILDETAWQQLPMFDVIVSNPPYIRAGEAAGMLTNVLNFEPHTALFVPDEDALLFYRKIADLALTHLRSSGLLFFEINEALGKAVCDMLAAKGFIDIALRKDMQGKDRMVRAGKA